MPDEVTLCARENCDSQAVDGEYCRDHECSIGGCSMSSGTGDGDRYCSTHECSADGCEEQAFGNELFCIDHRD